ncbi:hypothetical protein [Olleya aquimaris]|uniref:Uncharacterized protein n=1 Tax=Olleya aquimaris TaxID=639310 RepID=A0A327R502_9FLAO|nr:hypothetical protein [Olleya aquimaris]RAJ11899.1 hypothetical protein LY08_02608 [Olleya aquimaris]
MTEQDIKSVITEKLNQGISKSILYNEFKDKIKEESLRKFLASRPTYELKLKFKKSHLILSIIWGFFILLELFGILDLIIFFDIKYFISLILSIYITINIWKFDGRFFLPGIIWFVFTILNSFSELNNIYTYDSDYGIILIISFIYSLILIIGIYLMYIIRKNVFSYYNWFQPILNQEDKIQFE